MNYDDSLDNINIVRLDKIAFEEYCKKNEAMFALEDEILYEKLSQGINGIEWLVLMFHDGDSDTLDILRKICSKTGIEFDRMVIDAFRMYDDPDGFYDKYELNWWVTVDDCLSYLVHLRKNDYDRYFDMLMSIEN